jgi:hypothetical protein
MYGCRTVSIECCYQNVGIATSVAISMFEGEDRAVAMSVPLFYGIVEAITLGIYCIWAWKKGWTKAPVDDNFCHVITNSYEVEESIKEQHATGDHVSDDGTSGDIDPNSTEMIEAPRSPDMVRRQGPVSRGAEVSLENEAQGESLGSSRIKNDNPDSNVVQSPSLNMIV